MTPERWRQLNEIFHAALDLPPGDRESYLTRACSGDLGLHLRVTDMIRNHERTTGILDRSPFQSSPIKLEHKQSFEIGQMVSGRYEIVRFIAKGGMGEVYEAQDRELNDRVALKTLLPEIAAMERMALRFKREIQLSRKIAHRNVCRIFDITRHPADAPPDAQMLCLTMEYLNGETLLQALDRDGRMTSPKALAVLTQVADALDAAHHAGVVHRDLKAANVMLETSEVGIVRAVVTDFGLARRMKGGEGDARITETGKLLGTWDYMAPEVLDGAEPSPASDVYSLGILAYMVVTGGRPFAGDSPIRAVARRAREPIPPPSSLNPELEAYWDRAILGCLEPEPARRFTQAREFVAALYPG
jgi:serine/threonine protein kinase